MHNLHVYHNSSGNYKIRAKEEDELKTANMTVQDQAEDDKEQTPTIGGELTPEQAQIARDLWDSVKDDIAATKNKPFGKATGVDELRLKPDAKPFNYRPFRLDDAKMEEVSKQLINCLEHDVVEQSIPL